MLLAIQLFLLIGLGLEFGGIDNETFVGAFADEAAFVISFDRENQTTAVDEGELTVAPYLHSYRCGSAMGNVNESTYGALTLVEVGEDAFEAGLFNKSYHHGGSEDFDETAADASCGEFGGDDAFEVVFYTGLNHRELGVDLMFCMFELLN